MTRAGDDSIFVTVDGCPRARACTQRWESMEPVDGGARVRWCERCTRAVHRADDAGEWRRLAALGKCIASSVDGAWLKDRMSERCAERT